MADREIGRRSFLMRVVGVGALAGCSALVAGPAEAQRRRSAHAHPSSRRMRVDADPNDPARPATSWSHGCTDRDSGRAADPRGHGRRCGAHHRYGGVTSGDSGVVPSGAGGHGPNERWVMCPGHRRCP
jgi:hypothetical protein